jgi:hypothetical protein
MLAIRPVDFRQTASEVDSLCEGLWERLGMFALAAEEDGARVGLAVAESQANLVHVLYLDGRPDAWLALLERLVRLAGERDLSVWCLADRAGRREALEQRGFAGEYEDLYAGQPAWLYRRRG